MKAAHVVDRRWAVYKVATGGSADASRSGCSFLFDAVTGRPVAVLDDDGWLIDMRTAAAGSLATDLLANPGDVTVAVLGTGTQAGLQINEVRARRRTVDLRVWGRSSEHAEVLAASKGGRACASVAGAVADSDVVITCTSAEPPSCRSHSWHPGPT